MSTALAGSAARRLDCSLPIYTRTQNATSPRRCRTCRLLDRAFHRAALVELARVSRGQVRAFPLVSQIGRPETELVEQVMADLAAAGMGCVDTGGRL
ncbi:hypothetical protein BH24ACT11_BH24ACT11_00070 [soil metagenome]